MADTDDVSLPETSNMMKELLEEVKAIRKSLEK
jgi:hypothetical protein